MNDEGYILVVYSIQRNQNLSIIYWIVTTICLSLLWSCCPLMLVKSRNLGFCSFFARRARKSSNFRSLMVLYSRDLTWQFRSRSWNDFKESVNETALKNQLEMYFFVGYSPGQSHLQLTILSCYRSLVDVLTRFRLPENKHLRNMIMNILSLPNNFLLFAYSLVYLGI